MGGATHLCDVSQGRPRSWVPDPFRRTVFQAFHNLSNPGARATGHLVAEQFVWHGLKRDTTKWARECLACQWSKIHQHVRSALEKVQMPDERFPVHQHRLGGPTSSLSRILVLVNDRQPFFEMARSHSDSGHGCVNGSKSVPGPMGVPLRHPGGDYFRQGVQFISQLWSDMAQLLGTSLHQTTAYHRQANGMLERFHRQLKASLGVRLTGHNWMDLLPRVMLGIRATYKDVSGGLHGQSLSSELRLSCLASSTTCWEPHQPRNLSSATFGRQWRISSQYQHQRMAMSQLSTYRHSFIHAQWFGLGGMAIASHLRHSTTGLSR